MANNNFSVRKLTPEERERKSQAVKDNLRNIRADMDRDLLSYSLRIGEWGKRWKNRYRKKLTKS